ncbi:MAG: asparaginase [Bdellovibrionales bacterium]|nr:asparaginase [Bdellovibrionales bacterium]
MSNKWVPLVEYRRNNVPEITTHGAIAWVSGKKLIYSYGGNVLCYGRSMMKPLQLKVFTKELDNVLSWESKAVSIASHNAEPIHIKAVTDILKSSEMGLMQTPLSLPLMQFGKQLRRPRRWYHPCSGKHAAILRGCQIRGWSRVGYTWPHHNFHQTYLDIVADHLGPTWSPAVTAKDGCGLPTISMTVNELATLFAALAVEKDEDWIWDSFIKHPDIIGGFNRLDSTILKSCNGQVIAKEGADGLLGLSILHPDYPEGLGVVIKIAHGWDTTATWVVARWVLGVLGFDLRNPYRLERQKPFIVEEVIPPELRANMESIRKWDPWDPDEDRWDFEFDQYVDTERPPQHGPLI